MATKSILKNIDVKDRHFGRTLVNALEKAKKQKGKPVTLSKACYELKGESIKAIFGDDK